MSTETATSSSSTKNSVVHYMNSTGLQTILDATNHQKPDCCPGFNLTWTVDHGVIGEPIENVHFDKETRKLLTTLCKHYCAPSERPGYQYSCQPWANYAYILIGAYAQGHISLPQWKALFPYRHGDEYRGRPQYGPVTGSGKCHGFQLRRIGSAAIDGPGLRKGVEYDPVTLCPYTRPCMHFKCDPSSLTEYALIRAYATGLLTDMNMDPEAENPIGKCLKLF